MAKLVVLQTFGLKIANLSKNIINHLRVHILEIELPTTEYITETLPLRYRSISRTSDTKLTSHDKGVVK